jgi:hypothetical protein
VSHLFSHFGVSDGTIVKSLLKLSYQPSSAVLNLFTKFHTSMVLVLGSKADYWLV